MCKYGVAYSKILNKRPRLHHSYIDAFAGAGAHVSRTTRKFVLGSPLNALAVEPPFEEYHFIDIDGTKVGALRRAVGERTDVRIYEGDCNELLLNTIFPRVRWKDFHRALCLLDPYGLHLDWRVIETAGKMQSLEIFLNFPVLDMQRNILLLDPSKAKVEQVERMNRFWGDESWREIVYRSDFSFKYKVRASNSALASAFQDRLRRLMCNCSDEKVGQVAQWPPEPVVEALSTGVGCDLGR